MIKNLGRMTYDPMNEPTYENVFNVEGKDMDKWMNFYPGSQ